MLWGSKANWNNAPTEVQWICLAGAAAGSGVLTDGSVVYPVKSGAHRQYDNANRKDNNGKGSWW